MSDSINERVRALRKSLKLNQTEFGQRIVVSGFEPLDVMQSVLMLVRQVNDGRTAVENQYIRAVTEDGNLAAQRLVDEVFEIRDAFGQDSLLQFSQMTTNQPPVAEHFRFAIPPGADVIEQ